LDSYYHFKIRGEGRTKESRLTGSGDTNERLMTHTR